MTMRNGCTLSHSWLPSLVLVGLLGLVCLGAPSTSALESHESSAQLRAGTVITTRSLLLEPHERGLQEDEASVWLLGLEHRHQDDVWDTLMQAGGYVLHPLPLQDSLHWVVHADKAALKLVLRAHPTTTAAPLPHDYKMSTVTRDLLETDSQEASYSGMGAHGAAAASAAASAASGPGQPLGLGPRTSGTLGLLPNRPNRPAGTGATAASAATATTAAQPTRLLALMPGASAAELLRVVAAAKKQLAGLLGPACAFKVTAGRMFVRVTTCKKGAKVAAAWLAARPKTTWVDIEKGMSARNLLAGASTQAANLLESAVRAHPTGAPPEDVYKGVASHFFPHWKAGLTGKGQIVGVVDSGIDMDSCLLWDPAFKDFYKQGPYTTKRRVPSYFDEHTLNHTIADLITYDPSTMAKEVLVFESHKHRKVVQYVMWGDRTDDPVNGHGTHISATIVGSVYKTTPLETPSIATGIAPHAKVAFFDAAYTSEGNGNSMYNVYTQQGQDPGTFYELQRQTGARITSTSIGPNDRTYQAPLCYLMDLYAWGTQDTVHLVAAGNEGDNEDARDTTGTVLVPATCKNVVAVGASESWMDAPFEAATLLDKQHPRFPRQMDLANFTLPFFPSTVKPGTLQFTDASGKTLLQLDGSDPALQWLTMYWNACFDQDNGFCQVNFTSQMDPLAHTKLQLVLAHPTGGCNLTEDFQQPVMVLLRKNSSDSTCDLSTSLTSLAQHHAAAALVWWTEEVSPWATYVDVPQHTKLAAAMLNAPGAGQKLYSLLQKGKRVYVEWLPAPRCTKYAPMENVAWFSSYGTSATDWRKHDVRVKPDIVAPGYLTSAASDGVYSGRMDQCAVKPKTGTSMSTPVVAGATAIIRQYFTYGYYPAGNPCSKSKHTPSGPLMKAVLIAGAAAMQGVSVMDDKPLAPPPSPYQGFGRLDLAASLPLKKDTPHWKMQVVDSAVFTKDGTSHNYTLEVLRNPDGPQKPLAVSLVWYDYPGFPGAGKVLVNDLDLMVEGPLCEAGSETRKTESVSSETNTAKVHWGNGKEGGDFLNSVEKVFISEAPPGMYRFTVRARYIFPGARPQPYALVVLGNLKGTLDSPFNPATQHAIAKQAARKAARKHA